MFRPPPLDPWSSARPLVIGIAGGSGSGKTTVAEALVDAMDGVAYIRHDDYYRHRPDLTFEERTRVNYDHPDAFETELLVEHLTMLRAGTAVRRPVYDFTTHLRAAEVVELQPAPVVVVEGILVLAENRLRRLLDLKVFIDTDPDVRLARRIQRDIRERGRTVESVLEQYFQTVRPMHLQFVEPSKRFADIIIPEGFNVGAVMTIMELVRARFAQRVS